ncbi:hypothetical protein [Burkholderia gladioli]|uniref:hypothetical protein n=1 Tax=Burkholderia gladioli TaxID=28095 RepID=UPI00163F793B|nr:hypothetical protein [Burkholderia gladioli]
MPNQKITIAAAVSTLDAASKDFDRLNLIFKLIERANQEGDGGDVELLAQIGASLASDGFNACSGEADELRERAANG